MWDIVPDVVEVNVGVCGKSMMKRREEIFEGLLRLAKEIIRRTGDS